MPRERRPGAIVTDLQLEYAVLATDADRDLPWLALPSNPVHDRIFDDGLGGERGHAGGEPVGDLPLHAQAIREPHLLDGQVEARQLDLLLEVDLLALADPERRLQQV